MAARMTPRQREVLTVMAKRGHPQMSVSSCGSMVFIMLYAGPKPMVHARTARTLAARGWIERLAAWDIPSLGCGIRERWGITRDGIDAIGMGRAQ